MEFGKFLLYYHLTVFCVHYATIKTYASDTDTLLCGPHFQNVDCKCLDMEGS